MPEQQYTFGPQQPTASPLAGGGLQPTASPLAGGGLQPTASRIQRSSELILRTQGGFANRLRAIVSAVMWAEDLGRKLVIYWPAEPGHMPCSLDELLVPSSIPGLCCFHTGYMGKSHQVSSIDDMISVVQVFGGQNELRIDSYSNFHKDIHTERGIALLRQIRIRHELEEMAESMWKHVGGGSNWFGIHFRGTDHLKCLEHSPIQKFTEYIAEEIRKNPWRHFLLCTDEMDSHRYLISTFGEDRIKMPVIVHSRHHKEGQALAAIDWLLLQKCEKILGSAGSSFSESAALRSGSQLIQAL